MLSTRQKITLSLAPVALLAAAPVLAQTATQPGDALPQAPSAVIAQQNEALARPAGSGFTFTAPSTQRGPGGSTLELSKDGPLPLSLDDAISLALDRNLRLKYDRANQLAVKGDTLGVVSALVPDLTFNAQSSAQQLNLAAMGFKPALFADFAKTGLLPPGTVIATIVKVNTTQASLSANQVLFSLPDYELYRGTKNETAVVDLTRLNDRGDAILLVGQQYLQVLADQSNLANAQAQERSGKRLFEQASQKLDAGAGIRLDALRGQVEYQQRQQDVAAAQSRLAKDIIQLDRIMGLPAGQQLELTDTAPFAELASMDLEAAKITAFAHRKDLLSLEQQIELTGRELHAVKYQRLPTLAFNGYYGIIGLDPGPYHGDFVAEGTLNIPVFREAAQRGEQEVVEAQLTALRQRESDLRVAIESQIRAAQLDVDTAQKLVTVAQSSVELAQQELSDEHDRFAAGVDDDLPVVDAEASVAAAQAQLVQALFQYNVAKLQLARYTGVIESRYRTYLGNETSASGSIKATARP
jgi:outer membrane protein TolC